MKNKVQTLLILLLVILTSCKENNLITKNKKPNIILLFSDDQSFKDVHALGNNEVITPTMDKLVDQGVTMTHAYNMGGWNGAVCVASRHMFISGRSIWRAQQISKRYAKSEDLDKTWPMLMQSAGYDTYMTGKWHVNANAHKIFNHVGHVLRGMPHDTPEGYNRPRSKTDTIWQPWEKKFGGYWEGGKHWSELVKEDAISFIDSAAQKEKPFFMYIAFNAPHDPRQSPKKYVDMYHPDQIAVPKSFIPENPYNEIMDAGRKLRDERLAPFPRTEYSIKVNKQEYYALTTHLDDQIKEIMKSVEKNGLKENTYIFFTSDHGLAIGEHGLMGKQNMYDHSMRVPLMVIGPNIPKGKKIDADIYLQDIMATVLELAGVQKPEYIEFNSFMDLIKGNKKTSNYASIYGTYKEKSQRMIRKDNFKLILYPKGNKLLLFDLNNDPNELNDLSSNPEYKQKIKSLFTALISKQKEMGDDLIIDPLDYNL